MKTDIAVVLGYKNQPSGGLHDIATQRAEKALEVVSNQPCKIICTGGFGENFNQSSQSHAAHLMAWLQQKGIPKSQFLPPSLSRNTYEDGKFTATTIATQAVARLHLITSDFHLQRGYLWLKLFMPETHLVCHPAQTKVNPAILRALLHHEQQAIKNFYRDFPTFPPLATLQDWQQYTLPQCLHAVPIEANRKD